jgi:hypothetical protein
VCHKICVCLRLNALKAPGDASFGEKSFVTVDLELAVRRKNFWLSEARLADAQVNHLGAEVMEAK